MLVRGAGDVQIATKDWGGGDVPLLLTHGAFFMKETLDALVPLLLPTFRVVTFDMRNHGESGEGPWQWKLVTADVEAVRLAYEIERPVVAGHSLGGMVAALYAVHYPSQCRAAINVDGQGRGKTSQYDGMTEGEVLDAWADLDVEEEQMLEGFMKPRLAEMLDEIKKLDMIELWRSVPVPFLLFNCVADDPMYAARGDKFVGLMAAYRRGIGKEFAALADGIPSLQVATVDKTHVSVILEPAELAEAISAFATTVVN